MAQTDIIKKDLGLVTAYGYALAGGYQGTEEQFKRDFAALMSGQYAALGNKPSINGVTLVGNKTTSDLHINSGATIESYSYAKSSPSLSNIDNPFSSIDNKAEIDRILLYVYGGVSFLEIRIVLLEDVLFVEDTRGDVKFYARMTESIIDDDVFAKLCPQSNMSGEPIGVWGLSRDSLNSFEDYAVPRVVTFYGDKLELAVQLGGSEIIPDQKQFPQGSSCVISGIYMNRSDWSE